MKKLVSKLTILSSVLFCGCLPVTTANLLNIKHESQDPYKLWINDLQKLSSNKKPYNGNINIKLTADKKTFLVKSLTPSINLNTIPPSKIAHKERL